jgi:hypothetical protein
VVLGDFNTPLSPIDRLYRQKNEQRNFLELNDTIDLMNLIDIDRVLHPAIAKYAFFAAAQYTFFSAVHRIFFKLEHILDHKASLNKYKKIKIILCILSENSAIN